MAAFTITISNAIRTFGPASSDKWAEYNWNAFAWGEGTNGLPTRTLKLVTNSVTPDTAVGKTAKITFLNQLAPFTGMSSERLYDRAGYYHVYPNDTTELEDRNFPTWAQESAGTTPWTQEVSSSTSWSAA